MAMTMVVNTLRRQSIWRRINTWRRSLIMFVRHRRCRIIGLFTLSWRGYVNYVEDGAIQHTTTGDIYYVTLARHYYWLMIIPLFTLIIVL